MRKTIAKLEKKGFAALTNISRTLSAKALYFISLHRQPGLSLNNGHQPTIEVLVSTMNCTSSSRLIKEMRIRDYVIINQVTDGTKLPKRQQQKGSKFLSFNAKGLSKSRNMAIAHSTADICVLADDDLYYVDDYEQVISNGYASHPDADIIAFTVDHDDININKKPLKRGKIGLLNSMKISSVRITFKRASIVSSGILFNEGFGAGTKNCMGEENIFLADCIRAGLKVYSVPIKIATLRVSESTWFTGYNEAYFRAKGRVFVRISRPLTPLLIVRFAIRKYKLYKRDTTIFNALASMFSGYISESLHNN